MTSVLSGFATIWLVIAAGWVMARVGLLSEDSQETMANLAFHLGTPALLFLLLWRADLHQAFAPHLVASCLAMALTAVAYLLSQRLFFRGDLGEAVTGTFGAYYVNAANIGIPIASYVIGDATWAVPILLVQVALLQPIGLALLDVRAARDEGRSVRWWQAATMPVRNPITVGSLLGLAANLLHPQLPGLVVAPVELLGQLAVPVMLVAFGVSLCTGIPGTAPHTPQVLWISFLKLLAMPALGWACARVLGLDAHTTFAVTVMAGLPTAQNVFMNALRYRVSVGLARDVVFFTTVGSLASLFLVALVARG